MTPGYKTTEFWLGLISVILTYLDSALKWNVPPADIASALGLVAVYIGGRTYLKSKTPVQQGTQPAA